MTRRNVASPREDDRNRPVGGEVLVGRGDGVDERLVVRHRSQLVPHHVTERLEHAAVRDGERVERELEGEVVRRGDDLGPEVERELRQQRGISPSAATIFA